MTRLSVAALGLAALWLRARVTELRRGLRPAVSMSGLALVWPQRDPRDVPLAHRAYGRAGAPVVLLLHGLAASSALWAPTARELAAHGYRVLVPDLLGFGRSRRIGTSFTLADHTAALRRLPQLGDTTPLIVVGHSYGAAVAVAFAESAAQPVDALVLVSPPVFTDAAAELSRQGWLIRSTIKESRSAALTCGLMCLLRYPLRAIAARWRRDLPAAVARDSVAHNWPAVRDAVHTLVEANPIRTALEQPRLPTTVIIGTDDAVTPPASIRTIDTPVPVIEVQGDHLLPLQRPAELAALLASASSGQDTERFDFIPL